MERIVKYFFIIFGFTFILYIVAFTDYKYYYEDFKIKEMVSKAEYDWYAKKYMNHDKNYGYTLIIYNRDNEEEKIWLEQNDWWANYDAHNLRVKYKHKYRIHLSLFDFPFEKSKKLSKTEKYIYRPTKSSN